MISIHQVYQKHEMGWKITSLPSPTQSADPQRFQTWINSYISPDPCIAVRAARIMDLRCISQTQDTVHPPAGHLISSTNTQSIDRKVNNSTANFLFRTQPNSHTHLSPNPHIHTSEFTNSYASINPSIPFGIPSQNKLSKHRISCFGSPELRIHYTGNTQYNAKYYIPTPFHVLGLPPWFYSFLFHIWLSKRTLTSKFPTIKCLTITSPAGRSKSRTKNQGGVGWSIEFE